MNAAWDRLVDGLSEDQPSALELSNLLAPLAPAPLSRRVLLDHAEVLPSPLREALREPERRSDLLETAEHEGLLRVEAESVSLSEDVHSLLRENQEGEEWRRWSLVALRLMRYVLPHEADDVRCWPAWEELLPHALSAVESASAAELRDPASVWILERAAAYFHSLGSFEEARQLAGRAARELPTLDEDDPLQGGVLYTLGCLQDDFGEAAKARESIERALARHEEILDPDDPRLIQNMAGLSAVLAEKEPEAARDYAERAAAAHRNRQEKHRFDASAHLALGWILIQENDYEPARAEHEKALVIARETCGDDHPLVARVRLGFALIAEGTGHLEAARTELEQVLEMTSAALGDEHPQVAVVRSNLGSVLQKLGEIQEAKAQLELALHVGEARLPPDHSGLRMRHQKLAAILMILRKPQEAQRHSAAALEMAERKLGSDHPGTAIYLSGFAECLSALGEKRAAQEHYERALRIVELGGGPIRSEVGHYALHAGRAARELGDLTTARVRFAQALEAYESAPMPKEADVAMAYAALSRVTGELGEELSAAAAGLDQEETATLLRDRARAASRAAAESRLEAGDAEALLLMASEWIDWDAGLAEAALKKAEERVSEQEEVDLSLSLRIGTCWFQIGRTLGRQGRLAQSVQAFESGMPLLETWPQYQGATLHNLAEIRDAEGNVQAALDLYDKAAERKRAAGAAGSPHDLTMTLLGLGRVLVKMGRRNEASAVFGERLEILRWLPERDYQGEGVTLHDLGDLLAAGDREVAIDLYREAVACKRKAGEKGNPRDLATTLLVLGRALEASRKYDEALAVYEERLGILRKLPERDYQGEGITFHDLGDVHAAKGAREEAVDLYREAVACKRKAGERGDERDLASTLLALGRALEASGKYDEALAVYEERLGILRKLPERDYQGEGITLHDLGDVSDALGHPEKAAELYREAADHKRRAGEAGSRQELGATLLALGRTLEAIGKPDEAIAAYEERLEILESEPKRDHQLEGVTLHDMADAYRATKHHDEALRLYREALVRKRRAGEKGTPGDVATTLLALGRALTETGDFSEAMTAFEERMEILESLPEREYQLEGVTLHDMASTRREARQLDEALRLYVEAADRKRQAGASGTPDDLATTLLAISSTNFEAGRMEGARVAAEEAAEALRGEIESEPNRLAGALALAARAAMEDRKAEAAIVLLEEADRLMNDIPGADALEVALVKTQLAEASEALDRSDQTEAILDEVRAILDDLEGDGKIPKTLDSLQSLFTISVGIRDYERADEALRHVRALDDKEGPPGSTSERTANMLFLLGRAYEVHEKDYDAALPVYRERLTILASLPRRDYQGEGVTLHDIGDIHRAENKAHEALKFYKQAAELKRQAIEAGQSTDLATTLTKLGDTYLDLGDAATALRHLEEADRLTKEAAEPSTRNAERIEKLLADAREAVAAG